MRGNGPLSLHTARHNRRMPSVNLDLVRSMFAPSERGVDIPLIQVLD